MYIGQNDIIHTIAHLEIGVEMSAFLMNLRRWQDWLKPTILRLITEHKQLSFHELKCYLDDINDADLQGGLNCLMDISKICHFVDDDGILKYELLPEEDQNGSQASS